MGRENRMLTKNFFMHNIPAIPPQIAAEFKIGDFVHNGRIKSLDDINLSLPVQLSLATYMRLSEASIRWNKKVLTRHTGRRSMSVPEFILSFRKGSKPYRRIIQQNEKGVKIQYNCVIAFCTAAGIIPEQVPLPVPTETCTALTQSGFLSIWSTTHINNRFKDFLFKFYSNRLSVGSRLGHFNRGYDESCTFCKLSNLLPAPRETFEHLFFECNRVSTIHAMANRTLWPELNQDSCKKKSFWMLGSSLDEFIPNNKFLQLTVCSINLYIWECKIKKCELGWESCKTFVLDIVLGACKLSNFLNDEKAVLNVTLSRF
jgi:hypothetical protein